MRRLVRAFPMLVLVAVLTALPGVAAAWPAQQSAPAIEGTDTPCDGGVLLPPIGGQATDDPDLQRAIFRAPLPLTPLWNPPGRRRVGLQAGHWLNHMVPPELSRLQGGSTGGGKQEWQVNLELAIRTAEILESWDVDVDILPATVPPSYRAHVFLSLHADGDVSGRLRGYKLARPAFSSVPAYDDRLVALLHRAYGNTTGMPSDDEHVTRRMLYYYAFNSRRYCHAVGLGVPQAILETGFLTSAVDRELLIGHPGLLALGIANGIMDFLDQLPRTQSPAA